MGKCLLVRRGTALAPSPQVENAIHPIGDDGRPTGNVVVPDNVTSLHQYVFNEAKNMISVLLPQNLREISASSFANCSNLKRVNIPPRITKIPENSFQNCSSLEHVDFVNGENQNITAIGNYAFDGCTSLSEYVFSNNLNELGAYAFRKCESLTKIDLPDGVRILSTYCFASCKANTETNLSPYLTSIEGYAFQYNYDLKKVQINGVDNDEYDVIFPDTLKTIGNYAFNGCFSHIPEGIKMFIPKSIKTIGTNAFENCSDLKYIDIEDGTALTLNRNSFTNCTQLNNSAANNLISHTTTLPQNVFYGCVSLTDITVNNGVTDIGQCCFYGCTSLTKLSLPNSIKTSTSLTSDQYNYYFIYNCSELTEVILEKGWSVSIRLTASTKLTHDSLLEIINNLADLTGQTKQTLTLGTTNLSKLSVTEKKIATDKNWTLA